MEENKQLDPLQLSGDLTHEALVTCIESTEAAVELGSKISLHASHLMTELQEILDEAKTASLDSAMVPAAPILNLVEKFNLIVLESASLGALCGTFHDVTDKLTAALSCMKRCGLYTGSIPLGLLLDEATEIQLIATRSPSSEEWLELTLTEFLELPLLKRVEMLVKNQNKFYTAEDEEIPTKEALKTLRNVISSKKALGEDLLSVSSSGELNILIVDDDAVVQAAMKRKITE